MVMAWLLACAGTEPAAPVAPAAPVGQITAVPILETPTILGGIDNDTVAAALDLGAIAACNQAGRPGKVLAHFRILPTGAVGSAEVRSTTLRHPETEACVLQKVSATTFPPLESGAYALVTWPFTL